MTEDELLQKVAGILDIFPNVLWHHCTNSRTCTGKRGMPDLIIVGRDGILFRELKSDDGDTSADQDRWGWTINRNADWATWRPADFHSGRIKQEIAEIS